MKPFRAVCIDEDWTGQTQWPAPKKGEVVTVIDTFEKITSRYNPFYILDGYPAGCAYASQSFAPIKDQYADATAEIIEKFKPTEDTPDKIIIPEKLKSIS